MSVCAVVGGQFGSEGKGLIVGEIADQHSIHVRVGAANAGHTLYVDGEKHVMQQIPCAAYANPEAALMLGPGALISPEIFERELETLQGWREERGMEDPVVWIDPRAHVITDHHIRREQASGLAERIGSTSTIAREGIGTAQAARVMREEDCVTAADYFDSRSAVWDMVRHCDVPRVLNESAAEGVGILLEGTQGTGLSLTTGAFPYVTSRNTTVAGLLADCGLAPRWLDRTILVCRTFPIRVAGNSGPFHFDSEEIEWGDIGIDSESERTTVTKKIRRVATFSLRQVQDAVLLNGATDIALTFCDYLAPRVAGITEHQELDLDADAHLLELADTLERETGVHVTYLGTGPDSVVTR